MSELVLSTFEYVSKLRTGLARKIAACIDLYEMSVNLPRKRKKAMRKRVLKSYAIYENMLIQLNKQYPYDNSNTSI